MKYAIFDLDGTLTDSMGMWRGLANAYLAENNLPFQEDIKQLNNATWAEDFVKIAKDRFDLDICPEEFFQWISDYSINQYKNHILLKPTAYDFLNKLRQEGVKMCICSSTYRFMMLPALERLNILDFFDFTAHCREFGKEKDQPDIFLDCMKKLGADSPSEVVVFEDALYAAQTAKSCGFYVVGLADATELNTEKMKDICDQYVENYTQIDFSLLP